MTAMGASLPLAVLGTGGCSPPDPAVRHRPTSGGLGQEQPRQDTSEHFLHAAQFRWKGGVPGAIRHRT